MRLRLLHLAPLLALVASCTGASSDDAPTPAPAPAPSLAPAPAASHAPAHAGQLDGHAFPDKVISLTWDDGPDASTLALASYLESRHISATFFVVSSWVDGLSEDPGDGKGVFESGYEYLPILGDLVGLGHRIGNHTLNHVVLREAAGTATVDRELRENQHNLDPFLTNEVRFFRVPGGGWGTFAQGIVDHDAYLGRLVGPIRWDVDRKDWDESLHCRGPRGAFECERAAPGGALRMKAGVVAARYVASIESAGHGIVLLHDRVGHVGSTYGLEIAQAMIPQLEARGFVFAAPVLRFSPLALRHHEDDVSEAHRWDEATMILGDVNGDGRQDVCGRSVFGITCAISVQSTFSADDHLPKTVFRSPRATAATATTAAAATTTAAPAGVLHLADISGDGQADVCIAGQTGIACATSNVIGEVGAFRAWSTDDHAAALRFADVDGDGKADACAPTRAGVTCARNVGRRFDVGRTWLPLSSEIASWSDARFAGAVQLADVDGDGRADICGRVSGGGVVCALSTGKSFNRLERWSALGDFMDGDLYFGDVNGDRRADVCGRTREGVVCALATPHGFTKATVWLASPGAGAGALAADLRDVQLGDVNGDGRADLCGRTPDGLACAMAP